MFKPLYIYCSLGAIIFGLLFVFWPKTNTPYLSSTNINRNLCFGYTQNDVQGLKETGFPLVNKTTVEATCPAELTTLNYITLLDDFVLGALLGAAAGYALAAALGHANGRILK